MNEQDTATHRRFWGYDPTEWQRDAQNVKAERIQFWRDGIMISAQMTRSRAQEMVTAGTAYVISVQAIGVLGIDGELRG